MKPDMSLRLALALCLAAAAASNTVSAAEARGSLALAAGADQHSELEAIHVLNRLGYGPKPGEVERVARSGIDRYIDEQLHPERLPLPQSLASRLDDLKAQEFSTGALLLEYRDAVAAVQKEKKSGEADNEAQRVRRQKFVRIAEQTGEARLLRAVDSPRQLEEVMVDFWFNHFNVFYGKGLDRVFVASYERDAIRPYALGSFRDLLGATAKHPAMLFYLDNWLSTSSDYKAGLLAQKLGGQKAKSNGLNENYAREIMELHTLGVESEGKPDGYSQRDVTELARILTGWSFDPRVIVRGGPTFSFDAERHDKGTKHWLGRTIASAGQAEGELALDVLANHPATARHISFELAQYFVSDHPSEALVARLSARWLATGGDVKAVLKTLFDDPEFRDPSSFEVKFKTPYQYLVSMARAAEVEVTNVRPFLVALQQLGMPLYGCQTPDGYKNTEDAWLNPEGMTRRISFATALATGKLPLSAAVAPDVAYGGMRKAALAHPADAEAASPYAPKFAPAGMTVERGEDAGTDGAATVPEGQAPAVTVNVGVGAPVDANRLMQTLGESVSERTKEAVANADPGLRAALVLGSPDFMRR